MINLIFVARPSHQIMVLNQIIMEISNRISFFRFHCEFHWNFIGISWEFLVKDPREYPMMFLWQLYVECDVRQVADDELKSSFALILEAIRRSEAKEL